MARMLGTPASTLKSRFAAALLRLRERLYPLVHHRACPRSSSSPPPKDCWIRWARAKSPMPIFADRRPSTTLVSPTNRPINPSGNREAASDERIACGFVFFRFLLPNILPLWTVQREERLKTRRELRQELLSEAHRPLACGFFHVLC